MRRVSMAAVFALFAACTGQAPAGAIGQPIDLKPYLPDSLRAPSAATPDSTYRQLIPVGPDSAQVEMAWSTFKHTTGRYVSSISAELKAPAKYDSLLLANVSSLKNSGTKEAPVEAGNVQVLWFRHTLLWHRSGAMNFGFDAAGRRTIGPAGK